MPLAEATRVQDLVATSPDELDGLVCTLRLTAAGFDQAHRLFTSSSGLPAWWGDAASAFDEASGTVSGRYKAMSAHLPLIAQALADYAVAVRTALDAAWWAIEGMQQAALLTSAWRVTQPAPVLPGRAPSLGPAAPALGAPQVAPGDPGEPVRQQVEARWALAAGAFVAAGSRARSVIATEADMVAQERPASGPLAFVAGMGGEFLTLGGGLLHQAEGLLPWKTWGVVTEDVGSVWTIVRHPEASAKSILHWDQWRTDPAGAAGATTVDVLGLLATRGATEVGGSALDARAAAARAAAEDGTALAGSALGRGLDQAALARSYLLAKKAALAEAATEQASAALARAQEWVARTWAAAHDGDPEAGAATVGAVALGLDRLLDVLRSPILKDHPDVAVPLGGSDVDRFPLDDDFEPGPPRGAQQVPKPIQDQFGTGGLLEAKTFLTSRLNLRFFEASSDVAAGGHTLSRHVGRSVAWLKARLASDPTIPAASSFYDEATANSLLNGARTALATPIEEWFDSGKPSEVFSVDLSELGVVYPRSAGLLVVKDKLSGVVFESVPTKVSLRLEHVGSQIRIVTFMLDR